MWNSWTQVLRYAFRAARRDAGLFVLAVLILGVGIGANTASFSIVNPLRVSLIALACRTSRSVQRIINDGPRLWSEFWHITRFSSGKFLNLRVTGEREQYLADRGQNLGWVASLKLDAQAWVVAFST